MIIAGQDVPVTADMVWGGVAFLPTTAQYRVLGAAEVELQGWTVIAGPYTSGSVAFTVEAALNELTGSNVKEPRLIELQVESAVFSGAQSFSVDYVISADAPGLVLMTNSFQTYADSLVVADDLSIELTNWADATQAQRISALRGAFQSLSRLNYEIRYGRDDVYFRYRAGYGLVNSNGAVGRLYAYSPTQFLALDADFIACIRRAQVMEADALLGATTDSHASMREAGIMMNSVGDASIMFRSGKSLESSVDRKTLRHMANYISYTARLTRI